MKRDILIKRIYLDFNAFINQWNTIESPGADSNIYEYLLYGKNTIADEWEKTDYSEMVLGQLVIHTEKNNN